MITYKPIIEVYLNNRYVGDIRQCIEGYYYKPIGSKKIGKVFKTVEEVKESLMG